MLNWREWIRPTTNLWGISSEAAKDVRDFYVGLRDVSVSIVTVFILAKGGAVASWSVRSSPERAVRVRALAGDTVLCSAVSKWPAAGQGFKFTKWPVVWYFSQILRNRRDPINPNYHVSINRQAIQYSCIDRSLTRGWRSAQRADRDLWHLEISKSTAGHGFQITKWPAVSYFAHI